MIKKPTYQGKIFSFVYFYLSLLVIYIYICIYYQPNFLCLNCRGFGFVTYKTAEGAKKSIADPNKMLGVNERICIYLSAHALIKLHNCLMKSTSHLRLCLGQQCNAKTRIVVAIWVIVFWLRFVKLAVGSFHFIPYFSKIWWLLESCS